MKGTIRIITFMAIATTLGFVACSDKDDNDDSCTTSIWYQDADNDGLGNPDVSQEACDQPDGYVLDNTDTDDANNSSVSAYSGTASITQGIAVTTIENFFPEGGRIAGLGSIESIDGNTWTVPAEVNFTDDTFPFSSDLHNVYGNIYTSAIVAINALDDSDIIDIDTDGEIITAYIFADNYFEMYVNGVPVGKDAVPFTEFNSSIVRFKVSKPYTIAMKLVDWEENLGLGSESSNGFAYHPGDGGMVAVLKDELNEIVAITDNDWKAQTFYTAPIKDLSCVSEDGTTRSSANCDEEDSNDGTSYYGLHWELEADWETTDFDDSEWPNATTYANDVIGVDNKQSYTNFTDIFDDSNNDAEFIWSTNVVLDNVVLVRYTVE